DGDRTRCLSLTGRARFLQRITSTNGWQERIRTSIVHRVTAGPTADCRTCHRVAARQRLELRSPRSERGVLPIGRTGNRMVGTAGFEPALAGLRSRWEYPASLRPVGVSDGSRTHYGEVHGLAAHRLPSLTVDWCGVKESNPRLRFVGPRPFRWANSA